MNDKNVAVNKWQERSEKFDLVKEDLEDDVEFNEVLWYGIKGPHIPFPGPKRSAFIQIREKED